MRKHEERRAGLVVEQPRIRITGPWRRPALLRILHLCDLHLKGPSPLVDEMIGWIERLEYDLALIGGDLADNEAGRDLALDILRHLNAPLGSYAVPGNHDRFHYSVTDMMRSTINEFLGGPISKGRDFSFDAFGARFQDAGVRLLRNESVRIELPQGELWLLGLDDAHTEHDDLEATLRGVPSDACKVMLTHCPDAFPAAARAGVALVIAGHTHGGQIILPIIGALQTRSKLKLKPPYGLFRLCESQLYVNRGAGCSIPLRIACPPELALIELRIEPAAEGAGDAFSPFPTP